MKKLLLYTMIMTKGGAENTLANLANEWINDYDVTIVTNIKEKCEYNLNPKIKYRNIDSKNKKGEMILAKIKTKLSKERTRKLKDIIEEEKPDAILVFLPEPTIRVLSLKKHFPNIPIILSIRNHPQKEFNFPMGKRIRDYYYEKADSIIIQDISYKKYLSKNVHSKIEVIPNYISNDFMESTLISKKEPIVITVARLEKQKNIPLLIDAFSKLNTKFNSYKLYICGDGSLKNKLDKKINKMELQDRIILKGRVKNVKDEIEKASLFVLPSNYEGMPNVLLEAMALSLPVITTDSTEAIYSMIENNKNGIIIKKNDRASLTKKIEELLENDEKRISIGEEASKIKEKYNKKVIIEKWNKSIKKYL